MSTHDVTEGFINILWRGIVPPMLSMLLVVFGLIIGEPIAWIPIVITIAVLAALFVYRINHEAETDMRAMLKPVKIRPIAEVLEECEFLKKK
jgi:hypothetical protein